MGGEKRTHSSLSRDLSAVLKEVCLLFSSFSVARVWKTVQIKKTKHSTTNIKPLFFQQFYNTCQIDFPVSLCSFYASVV